MWDGIKNRLASDNTYAFIPTTPICSTCIITAQALLIHYLRRVPRWKFSMAMFTVAYTFPAVRADTGMYLILKMTR